MNIVVYVFLFLFKDFMASDVVSDIFYNSVVHFDVGAPISNLRFSDSVTLSATATGKTQGC